MWHFGKSGFSHKSSGQSGMIFDAPSIGLVSDSSWLSQRLDAYKTAGKPVVNYRLSEANILYDARLEGQDEYKPSVELGEWGCIPWNNLILRPIPQWKDYGVKPLEYTVSNDGEGNVILTARTTPRFPRHPEMRAFVSCMA